jgi:hypothetical protein
MLDENTVHAAMQNPQHLAAQASEILTAEKGELRLDLLPYALALLG